MRGRKAAVLGLIGLLAGLTGGATVWGARPEPPGPTAAADLVALTPVMAPVVGALAPDFTARDADGNGFRLSESMGRPVALNFWATWCEPCREEMPLLEARALQYGDSGLVVVGVNSDDSEEQVRAFRDSLGLTFPLVLDPAGEVGALYRVRGYPTTYFIDAAGFVRAVHLGSLDAEMLDTTLQEMGPG